MKKTDTMSSTDKNLVKLWEQYKMDPNDAEEIDYLYQKFERRVWGNIKKVANVKGNALIQIQLDGSVKFLENVNEGVYMYKIGDENALHVLDNSRLFTFPYGKSAFKGWITHVNYVFPFPHESKKDARQIYALVSKYEATMQNYNIARFDMKWRWMLYAAGAIALIIFAWRMFGPDQAAETFKNINGTLVRVN